MDVDKLVEEVARAIARLYAQTEIEPGETVDGWVDQYWPDYKDDARAAILATLRGVRECPPPLPFGDNDAHALNYSAQIDHLIKAVEG